ncbi:hypothetical protein O7608_12725 [Solwaraspora sp. WMMA2056]|uniref:hypothetical protein n=1 Tax=Solwaraspora sp. WMMA2056 TaxID=3015161 RepID=UPI00259B9A2C|nr:hypothetical protein [Solwaraspora sp. WMMA2056]WJK43175.1 hypothetical protein O7608_12725 [Solwaraspora sp. WMMA2056]
MGDGLRGTLSLIRWRWWDVLRLALVLLWLVAAGTAWWTTPRQQSYEQARADVAAGRVMAYQWGDNWDRRPGTWFGQAPLRSSGDLGPLFVWRTADGRVHWTDADVFGQVALAGAVVDDEGFSGPGAAALARDLRAAGLEQRVGGVQPAGSIGLGAGFVLGVVCLAVIVGGPAPATGTRWYWFWLVYLVPYGLGLLFWLAVDRPWTGTATAPLGLLDGGTPRRRSGLLGFGTGLLAAFLISFLTMVLNGILGDWWVPRPGDLSS